MLKSIREFALNELVAGAEGETARAAHARWFLARTEEAAPELHGSEQRLWLDRLEADLDNIRVALEWALSQPGAEAALRLASALRHFWLARGYLVEGRDWLERALAHGGPSETSTRVQAIFATGELSFFLNDHSRAKILAEEGLGICRFLGDARGAADALLGLGHIARIAGDLAGAAACLEEGIALARSAADDKSLSLLQEALATVIAEQGDLDSAETLLAEVLRRDQQTGNQRGEAALLAELGHVARRRGDTERAIALVEDALSIVRRLRDAFATATILLELGALVEEHGEHSQAVEIFRECLAVAWDHRLDALAAQCLGALISLTALTGDPVQAALMLGATESFCRAASIPVPEVRSDAMASGESAARAALGDATFTAARLRGAALTPDQAVAEALGKGRPRLRIVEPATPEERVM